MEKLSEKTNVINWFEIPVTDTARAKKFYETILDIEMNTQQFGEEELTFFPSTPDVIQATSGRVTGILLKNEFSKPSQDGTVVYINASPDIQKVLDKIEVCGGRVVVPRTQIVAGFIAQFIDTEGNRVALHSEY